MSTIGVGHASQVSNLEGRNPLFRWKKLSGTPDLLLALICERWGEISRIKRDAIGLVCLPFPW